MGSEAPSPLAASRIPRRHPSPSPRVARYAAPPGWAATSGIRGLKPAASFPGPGSPLGRKPSARGGPTMAHREPPHSPRRWGPGSSGPRRPGLRQLLAPWAASWNLCDAAAAVALRGDGRLLLGPPPPPRPAPAAATGADSHTGAGRPASVEPNRPGRTPASARHMQRRPAPVGPRAVARAGLEAYRRPWRGARRGRQGAKAGLLRVIREAAADGT